VFESPPARPVVRLRARIRAQCYEGSSGYNATVHSATRSHKSKPIVFHNCLEIVAGSIVFVKLTTLLGSYGARISNLNHPATQSNFCMCLSVLLTRVGMAGALASISFVDRRLTSLTFLWAVSGGRVGL
jgi:hypothetical protein